MVVSMAGSRLSFVIRVEVRCPNSLSHPADVGFITFITAISVKLNESYLPKHLAVVVHYLLLPDC